MELFRALAVLAEHPREETAALAQLLKLGRAPSATEYSDLFLFQLYPYASVYLGAEGMLGGEAADRVAGFWRAIGQTVPKELDHLATLLGLYARLGDLQTSEPADDRRSALGRARAALLFEHLLCWLPVFLEKAIEIGPPSYVEWGRLLRSALLDEAASFEAPERLPLHLREAPGLLDGSDGSHEVQVALLAPVRCGIILTRSDLHRAGRDLGLGVRAGERRFVLNALLEQDPAAVMEWLAGEAGNWIGRHRSYSDALGPIATFWADRAAAMARFASQWSHPANT
ncbi:MAG: molecular chaperone TorD family protein [Gemmatimonadales bacterium]|nr:molecular chaperone TorD family protein [Gemmatimonadales bacterium]